jgi:hypothetical protein
VAAAITVLVVSGSSLLVMRRVVSPRPDTVRVAVAPVTRARELAMAGGSLTDLSDRELASLIKEIETLDAVPSTEVESAGLSPVAPRRSTP